MNYLYILYEGKILATRQNLFKKSIFCYPEDTGIY